jgi:hypothetical protein
VGTASVLAVGLGVAGNAWADGDDDNLSQISGNVNSPVQDDTKEKAATLFTQVTTIDQDNAPVITAFPPEVVSIDFPNDMTYTTNSKLAECDPEGPDAGLISGDTESAVNACKSAVIGGGNARARIPAFPTPNNEVTLTVSVFNGPTSVAGDQDSTDQPTGGFTGGFPTILLHADNAALPATLVLGEVRNSTDSSGADQYGRELFVPDSPDVAGDAGALTQFNANVSRKWDNGKSGNKKKTYNLITAVCDDDNYDFKGEWEYDDGTIDTDKIEQDCVQK